MRFLRMNECMAQRPELKQCLQVYSWAYLINCLSVCMYFISPFLSLTSCYFVSCFGPFPTSTVTKWHSTFAPTESALTLFLHCIDFIRNSIFRVIPSQRLAFCEPFEARTFCILHFPLTSLHLPRYCIHSHIARSPTLTRGICNSFPLNQMTSMSTSTSTSPQPQQ